MDRQRPKKDFKCESNCEYLVSQVLYVHCKKYDKELEGIYFKPDKCYQCRNSK